MNIVDSNKNYIVAYVPTSSKYIECRITYFYGFPNHIDRQRTCASINDLYNINNIDKWLVLGDFKLPGIMLEETKYKNLTIL